MKDKLYNVFRFIGEYSLYGLLFFLAISNALVEVFVVLIFLGFIGRKIIRPDFKFLKFWPNIFLFLFLLFSAFSLINSGVYLNISLHALFGKWLQYFGICIVVQDSVYDPKVMKRSAFVFLFGALLTILSGLGQFFLGTEFLRNRNMTSTNEGVRAVTSSFSHYNNFGTYLIVVLSLLFGLLLFDSCKFLTLSLICFIISAILVILLTFSRGSWLGTIVSFIVLTIFSGKKFKRLIPFIFVVLLLWFLLPVFNERLFVFKEKLPVVKEGLPVFKEGLSVFKERLSVFNERLFVTFKEGGDSDRFRYWLAAWKMIQDHPFFGLGVGTFMANFSKYMPNVSISYAHNCYLQIWAETGIFALFSFVGFIVSFVCIGIKRFIVSKDFLLLGLLSGVLGFLAHSFFDTNLYSLRLAILFWAWVGLLSVSIKWNNN